MISNVANEIFKCTTPLLCNTQFVSRVTHLMMMNWKKPPSNLLYMQHLRRQQTCWSLRCSWSIACPLLLHLHFDLTTGFNGLGKDKCKTRWEYFKFWNLMNLILEVLRYNGIDHIPAFYILTAEWHVECSITNNVIRMNLLYTPQMGYISEK